MLPLIFNSECLVLWYTIRDTFNERIMKAVMLKGVLQLIKLIALDLDGTLLTGEKKITEENKKPLNWPKKWN